MEKQEKIQNKRGVWAYTWYQVYMGHLNHIPFIKLPEDEQYAWIGLANSVVEYDRIFWNKVPPKCLSNKKLQNENYVIQDSDSDEEDLDSD